MMLKNIPCGIKLEGLNALEYMIDHPSDTLSRYCMKTAFQTLSHKGHVSIQIIDGVIVGLDTQSVKINT